MRVALNASILQAPRTGIGQYVAGLATALLARPDIELQLFLGQGWSHTLPAAVSPRASARRARLAGWLRALPWAYALRRALAQRAFSAGLRHPPGATSAPATLYHEPSLWPLAHDGPLVMTIHDLTHVHYPHTQPAARRRHIERHLAAGVARAARILVDSAWIGAEVRQHFGLPAERVVVAPLGCGAEFRPHTPAQTAALRQQLEQQLGCRLAHGGYFLCVGTLEPRKNLQLALRAHARLPAALQRRYPLLIVGVAGWGEDSFSAELRRALSRGAVHVLGYLAPEALAALLAGACALVFVSLYEGFGLPLLEAMQSGTPVIHTRRASLPEVAGDAGLSVDAEDATQLTSAMQRLIEDAALWQRCQAAGMLRAREFSWARCAELSVGAYREALASSGCSGNSGNSATA